MKRKLLAAVTAAALAVCSVFGLAACGSGEHGKAEEWSRNQIYHWHACTKKGCGEKYGQAPHSFSDYACTVCGYAVEPSEGLDYTLNDTGYKVAGIGTCADTDIVVPSEYKGLPVTEIGFDAFKDCTVLKSIILPASVTDIKNSAFIHSSLAQILIPEGVTRIWSNAFEGCSSLKSVTIPGSVSRIEAYAFPECTGLKSITLPDGLRRIADGVFYGCSSLADVVIPDSVEDIQMDAFAFCSSLTEIVIPAGVTDCDTDAFRGCWNLERIEVAAGNDVYHSAGNCLIDTDRKIVIVGCKNSVIPADGSVTGIDGFTYCNTITNITIPDGITHIYSAFTECKALASVTIPGSVTFIGAYSFYGCSSLRDITFGGTKEQWNAIDKQNGWNTDTGNYTVHCTDGDIAKN